MKYLVVMNEWAFLTDRDGTETEYLHSLPLLTPERDKHLDFVFFNGKRCACISPDSVFATERGWEGAELIVEVP